MFLLFYLVGTILETNDNDKDEDNSSDGQASSDESNSMCSFARSSYDSMSEKSYELTPWHGKLSMSWESVGPDVMSSNLFLAPQTTG